MGESETWSSPGKVTFRDRTRPVTEDQWKHTQNAISLLDKDVSGKWTSLTWSEVQKSATTTLLMPSTVHQGKTTTCGSVSVIEAMASYHPEVYARLVLSIWADGRLITCEGKPWGDTPDINPRLLASKPADSIEEDSVADWMVAASMIAELKDQSFFRELLGHAEYLGQDARSPDGKKTVDYDRGLTTAWDVARMMRELIGCSTEREMCY